MARKNLTKGTSVATGYGHDIDKLYADLNEMLAEIYTKKPDVARDASNNVNGLVDPVTGTTVPIGGDAVLSVTTLRMSADTPVNTNAIVPFDTVVRDDKTIASAEAGKITLPVGFTQFRFTYHINVTSPSGVVTYRKAAPEIVMDGNIENTALFGVLPVVAHSPTLTVSGETQTLTTAAQHFTLMYQSPWIDVADLTNPPMGDGITDLIYCRLTHNAGAGLLSVVAGSSLTLETMTPN